MFFEMYVGLKFIVLLVVLMFVFFSFFVPSVYIVLCHRLYCCHFTAVNVIICKFSALVPNWTSSSEPFGRVHTASYVETMMQSCTIYVNYRLFFKN